MAEILTESFCERCGSRYTFESAVPRARLRGVKVLSRGLKNFVLDDKTSIDEAMAAARDDTDRSLTSHQLEAFHKTFNFCMQCRQYICPNCWNDGEGRCLTCAPTLGRGILPSPFPHLDPSAGIAAAPEDGLAAAAMNGHQHVADEPSGNGFDTIGRLDTFAQATAPTAPTELIGTSEVEARAATEPDVVAPPSPEPTVDVEPSAAATAPAPEAEPERFIYDPYDPPPPAPPKAVVADASPVIETPPVAPEVVEALTVTSEPAVVAEAVADAEAAPTVAAEDPVAPQDVVIEAETAASSDEVQAASDHAAAVAAHTNLVIAGLRPGESLEDALAAYEAEPTDVETAEAAVQPAEAAVTEVVAADATAEDAATPEPVGHHFLEAAAIAALAQTPDEIETGTAPEAVEPSEAVEAILAADAPVVDAPTEATAPEPVAVVEPLDEIQVRDAVAFETAADAQPVGEPEPEPVWQAEPLDDITPAEAAETPAAALENPIAVHEPEAVEAAVVEAAVEAAPEPVVTEPAAVVEAAPEPVVAEPAAVVEAAPEPVVAEPAAVVEAAPEAAAPATPESSEIAAADDIVAQPTWSILAPEPQPVADVPGPLADAPAPAIEPLAPAAQAAPPASGEPSWPTQPQWPNPQPSAGLPFLGRPVVPTGGVDALWAESSQAVSAPRAGADKPVGGVQPCTSCGLSLSASARFCRRCGTSQVG